MQAKPIIEAVCTIPIVVLFADTTADTCNPVTPVSDYHMSLKTDLYSLAGHMKQHELMNIARHTELQNSVTDSLWRIATFSKPRRYIERL